MKNKNFLFTDREESLKFLNEENKYIEKCRCNDEEDNEDYEIIEATNYFRVTDKVIFEEIVERIYTEAGLSVFERGDEYSLFAHDIMGECVPLSVNSKDIDSYFGEFDSTFKLLQKILPNNEVIIFTSTLYDKRTEALDRVCLKVTNKKIETYM